MNIRMRKFIGLRFLLTGAIAGLIAVTAAKAQAVATTTNPDDKDKVQKLEKYVVTGSYIPQGETAFSAGVSPVVKIDRKAIDESGLSTTSELLQKLSISNGGAVPVSNNATGFTPAATSISLRGLGAEATLVLINGRRVANYPVGNGGTTAFVDLNSIPLAAVDTVEVLKDGASAIYGADAVAGFAAAGPAGGEACTPRRSHASTPSANPVMSRCPEAAANAQAITPISSHSPNASTGLFAPTVPSVV